MFDSFILYSLRLELLILSDLTDIRCFTKILLNSKTTVLILMFKTFYIHVKYLHYFKVKCKIKVEKLKSKFLPRVSHFLPLVISFLFSPLGVKDGQMYKQGHMYVCLYTQIHLYFSPTPFLLSHLPVFSLYMHPEYFTLEIYNCFSFLYGTA